MVIYVETSALLCWLLNEPGATAIAERLASASQIVSSSLTLIEAQRAVLRAEREGRIKAAQAIALRSQLLGATRSWKILRITKGIEQRAAEKFPVEPIRTLDAIHLATLLEFLAAFPDLGVLSLDERIVNNIEPLGVLRAA